MNVNAELAKIRDDLAAMRTHHFEPSEWYRRVYANSRARMGVVLPGSEPAPVSTIPCAYCAAMREAKPGKCANCGAAWKVEP